MFCGFLSNHIDIAPKYAGTLMALTNTVATLPGIIMPIFVGAITHGNVSFGFYHWPISFSSMAISFSALAISSDITPQLVQPKMLSLSSFSSWIANDKRMASCIFRGHRTVCHRDYRLHAVRLRRRAAMGEVASSWAHHNYYGQSE